MRSLDFWGRSGKVDVIVPYSGLSGTALVAGQPAARDVSGFGDPRLRLAVNFYGAPSLTVPEFRSYERDLVIGGSLQVGVPVGQYDPSRAVNLGTNRWSLKPDIGFSKAFGSFTADLTAGVTFFGTNHDFFGGQTVEKDPLYSIQANLSYDFPGGVWASLGIDLLQRRADHGQRRAQGRHARQQPLRPDRGGADRPLLLDQVQCQQRHQHPHRLRLRHHRRGRAVPVGRGPVARRAPR